MDTRSVVVSLALLAVGFFVGRLVDAGPSGESSVEPVWESARETERAPPRLAPGARAVPAEEDLAELRALVGELRGLLGQASGASSGTDTRVVETLERIWTPVLKRAAAKARIDAVREKALYMLEMRRVYAHDVVERSLRRGDTGGEYVERVTHADRMIERVTEASTVGEILKALTEAPGGLNKTDVAKFLYGFAWFDWIR